MQTLLRQYGTRLLKPGLQLFGKTPVPLQRAIAERLFGQVLKPLLIEGELDFIASACVEVHITDINQRWYFQVVQQQIQVHRHGQAQVCFSGDLESLLLMASQAVDPDTLFFQRKLSISGDTELGLTLKNLLDSLELTQLPFFVRTPLAQYASAYQALR